ncbi:hypothetical protein H012_gp243 [Acanthamoeba polyphaga moumouvirus]|uniref:Uncharacterized protein n=1 Tax=Acanthamoeba polyphaga moumouvirus TaxID=1269028 RepID=L7RCA9_9VIRU|nr:hypothetical protein H012_gp243 [Acanthamoeba polyphaga moumouvirus]AGC02209.1 hypothetical protein Moumou_00688 [Acanthamoeba polyphaga moumouvirus]AQN68585.1 hypothetical protein [Saudi moumouvirus]
MSNYTFQIYLNDVVQVNSHGNSSFIINQDNVLIPSPPPGIPNRLQDLVNAIGSDTISFTYYILATGTVSSHDCKCTYTLMVNIHMHNPQDPSHDIQSGSIGIWSTSDNPDSGGSVNSGWQPIISGVPNLITAINSYEKSSGSGCWCAFERYGGWKNVNLSIRIDATAEKNLFKTNTRGIVRFLL